MRHTGIPVDPIYTLAAWEVVMAMVEMEEYKQECSQPSIMDSTVSLTLSPLTKHERLVVLHTGGTLDMFGLAQRFPYEFHA